MTLTTTTILLSARSARTRQRHSLDQSSWQGGRGERGQSTCGPCRGEADALKAAAQSTTKDARFVGLDVADRQAAARGVPPDERTLLPRIFDPDAQQLLKFNGILPLQAIPTTAVIDRRGRISARIIGPVSTHTLTQLIAETVASS